MPRGREREFDDLVGRGVYEGGFDGLRAYLRRGGAASTPGRRCDRGPRDGRVALRRAGGPGARHVRRRRRPAAGEVRVRHTAIGVNYIDVYVRRGDYRMIEPPAVPGMEAAGVVIDVGEGVAHLLPGDRVAYACTPPGAYADVRTLRADQVVALPDDIADETAAALMLKGLSAEYLTASHAPRARRARRCWCTRRRAVLGFSCARGRRRSARASSALCRARTRRGWRARTARTRSSSRPTGASTRTSAALTGGRGADVIFDGLGGPSRDENLAALATCGHWIAYGQAGGAHSSVDMAALSAKSATLSRPVLFHYTATRARLAAMADALFAAVRSNVLRPEIRHRYALNAAADAHGDLEARRTAGQLILLP